MIDLGTLGGANSYIGGSGCINTLGDVVGYADTSTGKHHVFLYLDGLGMVDLEASLNNLPVDLDGYLRTGNLHVNDNDVVVGHAGDGTGAQPSLLGHTYEAYLLTPVLE